MHHAPKLPEALEAHGQDGVLEPISADIKRLQVGEVGDALGDSATEVAGSQGQGSAGTNRRGKGANFQVKSSAMGRVQGVLRSEGKVHRSPFIFL